MEFYWPWALLLLLILPIWCLIFFKYKGKPSALNFSSITNINSDFIPLRVRLRLLPFWLRLICIGLMIVALARPRDGVVQSKINTESIAMQLVVDCSGSMQEPIELDGRQVSKLDAVKKVVREFLLGDGKKFIGRAGDFAGLITYGTFAETVCPLVMNHKILTDFLDKKDPIIDKQLGNTAIGDAIALGAARLYRAEAELARRQNKDKAVSKEQEKQEPDKFKIKSKVIILLTDGMQNAGQYSPIQAAELAKKWEIKIYSIAIAPDMVMDTFFGRQRISGASQINEQMLRQMAEQTGGFYSRAENTEDLKQIYEKIDALEKTEIQTFQYTQYNEKFKFWAIAALIVLLSEIGLKTTLLRKIP